MFVVHAVTQYACTAVAALLLLAQLPARVPIAWAVA